MNEITKTKSKVAAFLEREIGHSKYTQKELADLCNFKTANMITMLKQGLTKVPIQVIPALAKALNLDKVDLYKMVMNEYKPKELSTIIEIFGEPVTQVEREVLKLLKEFRPYSGMESEADYLNMIRRLIQL